MKNQLLFGAIAFSAVTLGSTLMAESASAYVVNGTNYTNYACNVSAPGPLTLDPINLANNVTNTTDCLYVDPPTNSLNDTGVGAPLNDIQNIGNFFGHSDWTLHNPYFDSVDVATGSWDLDSLGTEGWWKSYEQVMLTFKDGSNTSTLVSYLYDMTKDGSFSMTSNVWLELYGRSKDISHIGVYTRGTACTTDCDPPTEVPTPAAVLPILGGLLGAASRRKKGDDTEA